MQRAELLSSGQIKIGYKSKVGKSEKKKQTKKTHENLQKKYIVIIILNYPFSKGLKIQ